MSEVKTAVSPEQVQKTLSLIVSTMKWLSVVIPGETDDKVVSVVASLSQEPWVVPAIAFLINRFEPNTPITSEDFLLAIKVAKNEA
jgi:hypothetical protein